MIRLRFAGLLCLGLVQTGPSLAAEAVKSTSIRAPRDIGYFVGDLVEASVDIVVADGYEIETPSLPHPGPINYWLDLRSIEVAERSAGSGFRRHTLSLTYQDFYDALDARQQEIPTFPVRFRKGTDIATADVPAWTIGVSPLREIAPPPKNDPKDYMRADEAAPPVRPDGLWQGAAVAGVAALLALLLLAWDRATWPFHPRPARAFGEALGALRRLAARGDTDERYLDALLLLHRGLDRTDGRRVLADDLGSFLDRNPVFAPQQAGLGHFFAASRHAFFGSDPARSRASLPYKAVERLAQNLATAERTRP